MSSGDAESLIHYLQQTRKFDNAYFQYEQDINGRLLRVFWMTERQRKLYAKYSDVILQDNTNNKNRFNLPICFIACVDNEFVTRIVCQAILSNEDTVAFEFVFGHFSQATEGRNPGVIFTDAAKAPSCAIENVFPVTTKHFRCSWHLFKNVVKKLNFIKDIRIKQKFMREFIQVKHVTL